MGQWNCQYPHCCRVEVLCGVTLWEIDFLSITFHCSDFSSDFGYCLRAQNQVLKKGVVDEQANSASLKEQLKMKDQSLRKLQQEMDSLTFRNQQLAKRVELLQDELALSEARGKKNKLKLRDLAGQALAFVQELVTALLNFHTYTEQKVQIFPIDSATDTISPLNQKFSQYLHENASYVRPLEEGMLHLFESITEDTVTVLETTVKLKAFSEQLASYLGFLRKILPYQLKSLEEECESSLCTAALRARNMELHRDMKRLTAVFEKLHTYVSLLALPSTRPEGVLRTNYNFVFTNIAASLHGFHDILKDISKHYSQKAALEQEVPTATQKLITTNDCILSSVAALTNGAGKMASFFSSNLEHFSSSLSYGPKGGAEFISPLSAECMLQYKKKAAAYVKSLKKPCADSVPYEEALANRRVLLSSTESREGLAQQVQQSLEKIAKLEQEKEHWMLEAQLAKIKLEKENQKLKNSLSGHLTETIQEHSVLPNIAEQKKETTEKSLREPIKSTSLIGMLTVTTDNEKAPDGESREDLIKTHYMARIAELTSHLQLADSKSVHFHAECRALAKRLSLAEKSKESLTEELKLASQNITRLQDELMTTKRSYEDQLSMMSDHLCSMNETLTKQREEIDTLKMTSKGNSKKNKNR
uniref:protein phosphatase 1 regulatory subunit 21 isoform X12 n=1 Tax=Agelaius phoeniceus TaxID=39638 RepID=UPI0023ED7AF3|nr:protein phosphatase 1 regulatory subunit 21 isoform X12 [Agelaius phoeniceus]